MKEKIEKVACILKDNSRIYTIKKKKVVYIYDSYAHKIRILPNELYKIVTNSSFRLKFKISEKQENYLEKVIDTLLFQKERKIIENKNEQNKFIVNLNTSHRCNLNCSYCYKNKNNKIIANTEHLRKAINFIIHDYAPNANEYVFTYSMTSESSIDLEVLKKIKDHYIEFEDYTFKYSDIKNFKELSKQVKLYFPEINEFSGDTLVTQLNQLLERQTLFDELKLNENIVNAAIIHEIQVRKELAKWKLIRLNRKCFEIKFPELIKIRNVPPVGFSFFTNGTNISEEFISLLKELDIKGIAISFDGKRYNHDINRFYHNGKGSYDKIKKNLKILKQNNIAFVAAAVLNSKNYKPLQIVYETKRLGFKSCTMTIVHSGTAVSFNIKNVKKLLSGYNELFRKLKSDALKNKFDLYKFLKNDRCFLSLRAFLDSMKLIDHCPIDENIIIDTDGKIYNCLYFCCSELFPIGTISNGITNRAKFQLTVFERELCKTCWARYLCGGTCYYDSLKDTNDISKPAQIECIINKHLAKKTLELIIFFYQKKIAFSNLIKIFRG